MTSNAETSLFQCYCGTDIYEPLIPETQEDVCQNLPFYAEFEGNPYCVLHHPSYEKENDFNIVFQERLAREDYQFQGVVFPGKVNFSNYKFEKDVDFTYATFAGEVDFSSATFAGTVLFQATQFWEKVKFFSTTFLKEANFNSAEFRKKVDFWKAVFGENSQTSFHSTRFQGDVNFFSAIIKGYINFEGAPMNRYFENGEEDSYLNLCFGYDTYLNLEKARVENFDRVSFQTVRLHPGWFLNVDSRKFVLTDIHWENADGSRKALEAEIEHLKKREGVGLPNPLVLLAKVYRQIAANAETNDLYEEALKFRQMAFEVEWMDKMNKTEQETPEERRFRVLKTIYDLAEGNQSEIILYQTIESETGIGPREITGILQYLEQRNLIHMGGEWAQITSSGIDQIETARNHPEKPTSHFPANIYNNIFNAPVTGIQQGQNNIQNNTVNLNTDFTKAIEQLLDLIEKSSLNQVNKIKIKSDVQVIEQLASLEQTPEVLEAANSKIDAVKEVISMTADMTSLGMILLQIIQRAFGL
jgi:uncharacterized protein YjbI with pentapeptide repeats